MSAETTLAHGNAARPQRFVETDPYQIRMLVIGILGYRPRPAGRRTLQRGERLRDRQNLATHLLNGKRQSASRPVETTQSEHAMRHPRKRALIIIGLHLDGQHKPGPDLRHIERRIRSAQLIQHDDARLGHTLQGNSHNGQVYDDDAARSARRHHHA